MQNSKWRSSGKNQSLQSEDNLSYYLQKGQAPETELRKIILHRSGRGAGHMNNAGSTLVIGKPKSNSVAEGAQIATKNLSEPLFHSKARTLLHLENTRNALQINGLDQANDSGNEFFVNADNMHIPNTLIENDSFVPTQVTVWFHEPAPYTQDVVVDPTAGLRAGVLYELEPTSKVFRKGAKKGVFQRLIFILREENFLSKSPTPAAAGGAKTKASFQISLASTLQNLLDLPPRSTVQINRVGDVHSAELDTIEIYIKDVNFSRDSQWSLSSSMVGTCCYTDQRVNFMGNRIGSIKCLFKKGRKLLSGYIGNNTNIVFRSESAKLVFLVQLSKEMWHFEENGEIMFHKLVNTLFPMIFKRWRDNHCHHAITIVLFTTVDFTRAAWLSLGGGERPYQCQDYYRVVVDQVSVFIWDRIMASLRLEFANFKRDILLHLEENQYKVKGEPCPSVKGNLLEAIDLSLTLVLDRNKNTDLRHTINHLVVVTPGTGLFDVDYDLMFETSKKVLSLDYGLDIICLSQPPLHTVPLFRYRSSRGDVRHCVPKWCDMSFYGAPVHTSSQWIPRCKIYELQMMGLMENEVNDVQLDRLEFKENIPIIESMNKYDECVFGPVKKKPLIVKHRFEKRKKREISLLNNTATLSLMRIIGADDNIAQRQRAATNVSTTNSSVNGLVTNISVANSALSALYTLNKTGEDPAVKAVKSKEIIINFPTLKNSKDLRGTKDQKITPISTLQNEISELMPKRPSTHSQDFSKERRESNLEIQFSEDDEINSYWKPVDNPSEPQQTTANDYSRWAEAFPPNIKRRMFKWRSLKAPAALPIGTMLFPTSSQMDSEFTFQTYVVTLNWENRLELKNPKDLMREMIRLRLAQGFQICYGDRVKKYEADRKPGGYPESLFKYLPSGDCVGSLIYLSLNDEIHRILSDQNGALNVQLYKKVKNEKRLKISLGPHHSKKKVSPLIRTRYADEYTPSKVNVADSTFQYFNWNQMDQLIAGYEDAVPEIGKHFHQMKFVVMPGPLPANAYHISNEKLSDEEIRLEGLRKLIALIERGRYQEHEEKRTRKHEEIFREIYFYTGNLHDFLNDQEDYFDASGHKTSNSLTTTGDSRFNMNIKLSQLAQELQTEGGLKLMDRTWHFKTYLHCFLGSDLVSWLIRSFNDIDSRDSATEYGQILMDNNLFFHVEQRHRFLDGHYFYEFCGEYIDHGFKLKVGKKSWFHKAHTTRPEESKDTKERKSPINSTPNSPPSMSPQTTTQTRSNSIISAGEAPVELSKIMSSFLLQESEASSLADSQKTKKRKKFMLSRHVKYNCDPSENSFRPELLDVHYDTVHNPDHCFHIRLQWLNTTTKFIDEVIINWSRFSERYGLKLVETPWRELCTIPEINPFHSFVDLKLAVNPLVDMEFKDSDILKTNKFYFHLHFLKVADFLLDNRGTSFFSKELSEICYTWGVPSFKYAQFIHKSGTYIVELRENGEFCMAPNNVHILRINTFVNAGTEKSGKNSILDSQRVMLEFRDFCQNEEHLRQVFRDASKYLHEDFDAAYVLGM